MLDPAFEHPAFELRDEVHQLEAEEQRLSGEGRRLRTELRRARAPAHIASRLHQDLFCPALRVPALASEAPREAEATATEVRPEASAALLEQLHSLERLASEREAEVEGLKKRLAEQEVIQSQATELAVALEQRFHGSNGEVALEAAPKSAREVRLVREIAELRRQIGQVSGEFSDYGRHILPVLIPMRHQDGRLQLARGER